MHELPRQTNFNFFTNFVYSFHNIIDPLRIHFENALRNYTPVLCKRKKNTIKSEKEIKDNETGH